MRITPGNRKGLVLLAACRNLGRKELSMEIFRLLGFYEM
jgi:hypothetical protein